MTELLQVNYEEIYFSRHPFGTTVADGQDQRERNIRSHKFPNGIPCFARRNKEYVASMIGLYKNNGAVLYVGIYFPFI